MSVNTVGVQDYVRYVYVLSLVSALAMAIAVDYVLTELWIYGTADLTILVITPVFMFMISMLVISSISMIKQLKGNFGKMSTKAKALMMTYISFFIVALVYFTYISVIHYAGLGLTVSDPQLIGDHYLGFGLALYDAGLLTTSWQLTEDLMNNKFSTLYRLFVKMFKPDDEDNDNDTIVVK